MLMCPMLSSSFLQKHRGQADAIGCTIVKLDKHAAVSYHPTAADKALKEKLRTKDRHGGKDKESGSERRSPGWSWGSKKDDRDKKNETDKPGVDEDKKIEQSEDGKQAPEAAAGVGQQKVGLTVGVHPTGQWCKAGPAVHKYNC